MITAPIVFESIAPTYASMADTQWRKLFPTRAEAATNLVRSSPKRSPERGIAVAEIVGKVDVLSNLALRRSILQFIKDPSMAELLVYVNSPGGSVAGTDDVAQILATAAKTKRVTAFIEDVGASAAYDIISGATEIIANRTAAVGSIGTVVVLLDTSRMMASMGIDVYVVRSGAKKAIGTNGGKLSDDDIKEVQATVDAMNRPFLANVAKGRKLAPKRVVDLSDGRIFIGTAAVAVGLVDRIALFEEVLTEVLTRNSPAAAPNYSLLQGAEALSKYQSLVSSIGLDAVSQRYPELKQNANNERERIAKASRNRTASRA